MIRNANTNDIAVIHSLLLEGVSSGKVLKRSVKELEQVINSFFVYEEGHKIVGCCSLEIYSKKLAEIRSLVVSAKFRKKGIGSALVERCLSEAKKKKVYQVLSVTNKQNLFQRYGFRNEVHEKRALLLHLSLKGGVV